MHVQCGTTSVTHGQNHCRATAHDVATSIEVAHIRLHRLLVDHDGVALADFQSVDRAGHQLVGRDTHCHDDQVDGDFLDGTLDRNGLAAAACVGLAQLHALHLHGHHTALVVANVLDGVVQRLELDALFLGMAHLFETGGHLLFATAIYQDDSLGAHALGRTGRVHGCVAATDDGDGLAGQHRSVAAASSAHQVDARQVFVARHHTIQVLAGDVHEAREAGTRADKYALEAHLVQVVVGDGLAHEAVFDKLHTHLAQAVNLVVDDAVGQTELGDAILEHATNLVQCLKHSHIIAALDHVASK